MAATAEAKEIIRPLRQIEAEIKELFTEADQAAEEAKKPYYEEAGPLLVEARESHFQGNSVGFYSWATKKFGKSQTQIRAWVAWGDRDTSKPFKTLSDHRYAEKQEGGLGHRPRTRLDREWTGPVDEIAERAQREAMRLAQEDALTRAQEAEAKRKLKLRIIDIGYKVLAKELHPDKLYGDRDAMARLNRCRDELKHSI